MPEKPNFYFFRIPFVSGFVGLAFLLSPADADALVVNVDLNASNDTSRPANRIGVPFSGQGAYADPGNDLWNIVHSGESARGLLASDGTLTTLNLTVEGGSIFVDTDPTDNDLLRDYFFQNTTTTIYGLEPDTSYTLYVYAVGDQNGQGSNITVGFGPGLETQNYVQQESQTLSTTGDNTPATYVLGGNYQIFTANSSPNGRLVINSSSFINGLQIVGVDPIEDIELVHPGLSHKYSDLQRIKAQIEAKQDPWYSSYLQMLEFPTAGVDYVVRGFEDGPHPDFGDYVVLRNPSSTDTIRNNFRSWEADSRAAYYNALQWFITGDVRHAEKAVEIFNVWTDLTYVQGFGTHSLASCMAYVMIEAAELIKHTYDGWPDSEIQAFGDMLVYPGYSTTSEPNNLDDEGTWYWRAYEGDPNRAGNQDICGWRTLMAIGVFLDNPVIYDRGLRYLRGLTSRPDDLPYPSGPRVTDGSPFAVTDFRESYNNEVLSTIPDYGYNGTLINYIWESGQCEESSRDQAHTLFGVGMLGMIGEVAWNQGFDFYGAVDSRLLDGFEFSLRYNLSFVQSFSDQLTPWEPTVASGEFIARTDAVARSHTLAINPYVDTGTETLFDSLTRGTVIEEDIWELPVAHYLGRGIKTSEEVKWSIRTRDYVIEQTGEFESAPPGQAFMGLGGMSFRRPEQCHGDPISGYTATGLPIYDMPEVPGVIEAENFDHFVIEGQSRTYNDLSSGNSGGEYRLDEDVDIIVCSDTTGGYAVSEIEDEEWLSYTVNVLYPGNYSLAVRYAGAVSGQLRFAFDGADVTGDVILPETGSVNTWETYTLARNISLRGGAQSLRLYVSGASEAFDLNQIIITREDVLTTRIEAEDYDSQSSPTGSGVDGVTTSNLASASGGQHLGNITGGDWVSYDNVVLEEGTIMRFGIGRPDNRAPGRIEVRLGGSTGDIIGVHHLEGTGGWEIFESFDIKLDGVSGTQTIYLTFENNGAPSTSDFFNLDWIEFEVPDTSTELVATRVQAEAFTSQFGTDTETTSDVGGGQNVGNIDGGDWLRYDNVNFRYNTQFEMRLARPAGRPNGLFEIRLDSPTGTLIGSRRLTDTGAWQGWVTCDVPVDPTVTGSQTIYIVFNELGANVTGSAMCNFNWFEIASPEEPVTPTNITETPETGTEVLLSWDVVDDASGYIIRRSTSSGGLYEEFFVGPDETSFLDDQLVAGTEYFYTVSAIFDTFESSPTSEIIGVPSEPISSEEMDVCVTGVLRSVDGTGDITLTATNTVLGHNYQITTAQDLENPIWVPASTVEAGDGGEMNFEIPLNAGEDYRFYRMDVSQQ